MVLLRQGPVFEGGQHGTDDHDAMEAVSVQVIRVGSIEDLG